MMGAQRCSCHSSAGRGRAIVSIKLLYFLLSSVPVNVASLGKEFSLFLPGWEPLQKPHRSMTSTKAAAYLLLLVEVQMVLFVQKKSCCRACRSSSSEELRRPPALAHHHSVNMSIISSA